MFVIRPVGVIRHGLSDAEVREKSGLVEGTVEVFPEYADGLAGLEEYSHLFILSLLHREEGGPVLKVKPRRLLRLGWRPEELPELGVFASDSPTRPNPIGLTLVKLLKRRGRALHVAGLDLFEETPVLDIKPYRSDYHAQSYSMPSWVTKYAGKIPSI